MTPRTDNYKAQGREWLPLGIFEDVERENSRLREALALADKAIVAGQACRSEAEFNRWMRDSQSLRPRADLFLPNSIIKPNPVHANQTGE